MRVRQKYIADRNANIPRIASVPARRLTLPLKTRIGSFDNVVHAKTPNTAYAIKASANFFLIVTQIPSFKVSRNPKCLTSYSETLQP